MFGSSTLAFTIGGQVYELGPDLDTAHPVDLAGRSSTLGTPPREDRATGELHFVAVAANGSQAHVVIEAGALIRRCYPFDGPERVTDLAITRDHVVFATDGYVGVSRRDRLGHVVWTATATDQLTHQGARP